MKLNIQTWLEQNSTQSNWVELLYNQFGICTKPHPAYPNLWQFTYGQVESYHIKSKPMVCECRGLILDQSNNWAVVAFPFIRFFNQGEIETESIDWSSIRVQEKVDGSLIIVYYYNNTWNIATKFSPNGEGTEECRFADLVWKSGLDMSKGIPGWTYVFELTSKFNQVVTDQTKNEGTLTLIGVRDNQFMEHPVSNFPNWNPVKEFPLNSLNEILYAVNQLNPTKQEGFVAVDKDFNRVKIKSPEYVLIHRDIGSKTINEIILLILNREDDELTSTISSWKHKIQPIKDKIEQFETQLEKVWDDVDETLKQSSKKEFAAWVVKNIKDTWYQGFLFAKFQNRNLSAWQWMTDYATYQVGTFKKTLRIVDFTKEQGE